MIASAFNAACVSSTECVGLEIPTAQVVLSPQPCCARQPSSATPACAPRQLHQAVSRASYVAPSSQVPAYSQLLQQCSSSRQQTDRILLSIPIPWAQSSTRRARSAETPWCRDEIRSRSAVWRYPWCSHHCVFVSRR